jgi:hypothetical protein
MKNLRLYILFVLASVTFESFAIKLPSHSFFGANELYADSFDNIEYSAGTQIGNINILLENSNDDWGVECLKEGENGACLDCCQASLDNVPEDEQNADTYILYNTCRETCGDNESLAPLGSALWLLPFAFAYGFYKRYNNKKADC